MHISAIVKHAVPALNNYCSKNVLDDI